MSSLHGKRWKKHRQRRLFSGFTIQSILSIFSIVHKKILIDPDPYD